MSNRDEDVREVEALSCRLQEAFAHVRVDEVVATELSVQQLKVLMLVQYRAPMTAHAVADALCVSAATVSGLVSRLVAGGFLVQEPAPDDRRALLLRTTAAGSEALEDVAAMQLRHWRDVVPGLTDAEVAGLRLGLAGIERVMRGTPGGTREG
ncbi:MarR family winged helix-turn-helix transcriptional regulator [Nocardioides sp. zg-1228]|uniref:MarR family winged helix-turn-helix transcriptional regulator n=1 Tax=Nocardioides sp. zg-1228 TaxID=2763008 RepID=UPI00164285A5|nr:MarR family transcriptional regulator [Nocardioides sp. zg-1228]MBC2934285.1 MarR family transcriptional regulator [Nocardioides sp. zg-1228]QSF59064.1 MarR family transcriptional regulator [Nocardioides sp. zg-1228]